MRLLLLGMAIGMFGCSQYAFKDLGDGRGVRGALGYPIGEAYAAMAYSNPAPQRIYVEQQAPVVLPQVPPMVIPVQQPVAPIPPTIMPVIR